MLDQAPEEKLCVGTGGKWDNGKCDCGPDMAWDADKGCMDAGPSPEEKLCIETGGKWDNGKCACGPDMVFDLEKGCMDAGPSPERKALHRNRWQVEQRKV